MNMNIVDATRGYEDWIARQITLVSADLRLKHTRMQEAAFPFLRATYYRWVQLWSEHCADIARAPRVLAVGDLHIENFGTWRDADGRLAWGVNDFDEVAPLPYTNDLVRLATSACLAIESEHLSLKPRQACDALLSGYRAELEGGGRPIVLAERHYWLSRIARRQLRDPRAFWKKLASLPPAKSGVPADARKALESSLPEPRIDYRLMRRVAGLGSLGHQRYVAIAHWHGGMIAREAKALVPPASAWARGDGGSPTILYERMLRSSIRSPDPFLKLHGTWIVRRLAPDCGKIELGALPQKRDELRLLEMMGWETANVHLGTPSMAKEVLRDLDQRPTNWLVKAARTMTDAVMRDWKAWRSR